MRRVDLLKLRVNTAIQNEVLQGKSQSFLKLFPAMQHHVLRSIDLTKLTPGQQANIFKVLGQVSDLRSLSLASSQYLTDNVLKHVTISGVATYT